MAPIQLEITIERNKNERQPDHHVLAGADTSWTSYLPSWSFISNEAKTPTKRTGSWNKKQESHEKITGFKNPWPSFHKPTKQELWTSLAFGNDEDPCLQLSASHVPDTNTADTSKANRDKQAAYLLRVQTPDFSFDPSEQRSKSTWLGHASMLLQLPPLEPGSSPIRILFDPIFSMRCSPSQAVGPVRSYLPPCKIESLPPIDIIIISHNHYDHLDYDTIQQLWKLHKSRVRFLVPLGNRKWFVDCGIADNRVDELDWWESATLTGLTTNSGQLRVTCTPAQHSSGRDGADADATLWSSWYLEHTSLNRNPYKIFFAGDSGYQFHGDPKWPPQPPSSLSEVSSNLARPKSKRSKSKVLSEQSITEYPPCPAFKEIVSRLGSPHLLYLPIALGATWAYFRSFFSDYLPDSLDPFPRHSSGVTGAIHMPPWDAVQVLREMTEGLASEASSEKPIAIGMHWGTFVTDPTEVLKTLGQLEWACDQQDIKFLRTLEDLESIKQDRGAFIALNHGDSVIT